MASERNIEPRKQVGEHLVEEFEYPFSSCALDTSECPEVGLCQIEVRHIPHIVSKPPGDFPTNIKRWIWSAPGANDELPWDCIVELASDENYEGVRYAYFHAWCDYTGFDCQGGAYVIVSSSIPKLIEFGLGNAAYQRYMKGTEPAEEW